MTPEKLLAWFEEIAARDLGPVVNRGPGIGEFYEPTAYSWVLDASAALGQAFPSAHPIAIGWKENLGNASSLRPVYVERSRVVFNTALRQLKDGRLASLADGVTAENVGDLLTQAESLLPGHYLATAIIAGGALETFLRHLVTKNGLTWNGSGQISKYHAALAQHRNATGTGVVTQAEEAQILAWGALRNSAAHNPIEFTTNHTAPEVSLMIAGVRNLVVKYS